ncbi:MAG TPA: SOS response-associated peptidase family protein [Kofleriaceae bacterium]
MLERFTQPAIGEQPRRFNVAPGQQASVITDEVQQLRWGMLSPWRGHGGVRPPPIRIARLDQISSTPVLAKAKRCIVAGDGWYARGKVGKNLHAWWLQSNAQGFAGVWTTHADDSVPSFAVIVQPSPGRSELLPCGADERWILDGTTSALTWRDVEVSRYFENEAHDDPQCIAPLSNPNQGSLF